MPSRRPYVTDAIVLSRFELGEADRVALLGLQLERAVVESARFEALRRSQEALGALEDALHRPLGSTQEFRIPESSPRLQEDRK